MTLLGNIHTITNIEIIRIRDHEENITELMV
jgi:hypothetical protein